MQSGGDAQMQVGDEAALLGIQAEEEEEEFLQVDIEGLQAHGINVADIKKLKLAGICTLKGVKMITKRKLCAIKGLSEAKVDKIREAVLKMSGGGAGFVTAMQV